MNTWYKTGDYKKIKIIKESDGSWEHMTFVNGAHWVKIDIDWLLSDENIFWNAKIEDKMKLLFIASWEFWNVLEKIDSISYNVFEGSEFMLLKDGTSYNYVNLSKFWLDKSIAEKFFNNYANLVFKFRKVELSQSNESRIDYVNNSLFFNKFSLFWKLWKKDS